MLRCELAAILIQHAKEGKNYSDVLLCVMVFQVYLLCYFLLGWRMTVTCCEQRYDDVSLIICFIYALLSVLLGIQASYMVASSLVVFFETLLDLFRSV